MESESNPFSTEDSSLMVVSQKEEFCILYDRQDMPGLLEELLKMGSPAPRSLDEAVETDEEELTIDHFRSVVRELICRIHGQIR
ncbi:MAG: hypothetical protein GWP41_00475 [Planctomycetia bacterium]|jgi:hypothetical protein|nr:hypothetical protein [Planctomycetia bacterium]NCF99641.1 hypothetical protein [Planctomycetia bacterium]NCG12368.1 hypothetical protein [Planctomycetia bacterium]NCG56150.1 hypothetical protein [Pseudomonadota bacterium]